MKRFICFSSTVLIVCIIISQNLFAYSLRDTLNPVDWNPYEDSKPKIDSSQINNNTNYNSNYTYSWDESDYYPRHRISLDISPVISRGNPGVYFGINYEFFVSKYISLDYNFSYGTMARDNSYGNINAGIVGSGCCIVAMGEDYNDDDNNSRDDGGLISLAILSAIIPEGVGFHMPLEKNMNLSFHIAPLSYQFMGGYSGLALAVTTKFTYQLTKVLSISPYIKFSTLYSGESTALSAFGAQLGFCF